MTSHKDILADWAITCEALALEYWESNSDQDPSEYAHECASGCQWVIYYNKGWDIVMAMRDIRPQTLYRAEDSLDSLRLSFECLDKTMTLLAYCLTYNEILTQINEQEESEND